MEKQEILKDYKRQEDKIIVAQVLDKIKFSRVKQKIEYTDFFDMYQISCVESLIKKMNINNCIFYGGFKNAERKILIIYPEKFTAQMIEKNYNKIFKIVRVELSEDEKGKYSHRNYLGGVVKLGLKREKVGDIIVSNEGADIVTFSDFSNTLQHELGTLTRFQNSLISVEDLSKLKEQQIKTEEIKVIVPSLRLDNIVSDLAKTSRTKASQIVESERVFINGKCETKLSKQVKLGDKITIRGKGRFTIKEFTGKTRSGRIVVLAEKLV